MSRSRQPWKVRLAVYTLLLLAVIFTASKILGPINGGILGLKTFNFSFENPNLAKIINDNLSGKEGEYAVYIENLKTGEKYGSKEKASFPAASLYKLFLFAAVMEEVEKGNLKMDTTLTRSKAYLTNRLGSVDFGYENAPSTISYSVEEALQRVGRISDNFAAIMLADKIGWDKIQQAAEKLGVQNTLVKDPIRTSAYDVSLFYKALYSGKVVSPAASKKIIGFLALNQINDRIPAGIAKAAGQQDLPAGRQVVHKTGELSRIRHDAGIVYLPTGEAYIIVLMSKDLKYENEGIETLANISKEVFDYLSKGE